MKTLLFIFAILIAGCSKDDSQDPQPKPTTGRATFYIPANIDPNDIWHLLVDGVDKGDLVEAISAPGCGSAWYTTLDLTLGNHVIDAQNMNGQAWGNPVTINIQPGCAVYAVQTN